MKLTCNIDKNIEILNQIFPIGKSFDMVTRNLYLGNTKAYFLAINGLYDNDSIQSILSDLQDPLYVSEDIIHDITNYMNSKIGYPQAELTDDMDSIIKNILSGPCALFIDGYDNALILDARQYSKRSIEEPDAEMVTKGAKDGFIEAIVTNTSLIRRRVRNPKLTFERVVVGNDSRTDVAIGYIDGIADEGLVSRVKNSLDNLSVSSLTMGAKSLDELLIKKRFFNPLPTALMTERPDVACSYIEEGYVTLVVDNSPMVLILPCTVFQFTQSPEDYYKSPSVGNYLRLIRFGCVLISLLLLPLFLLFGAHYPDALGFPIITSGPVSAGRLFMYVIFIELGLDLFKYSCAHTPSRFSNPLSIIGGLIISDVAINLNWASTEVIFYGALTMLATLSLANIEFSEAIRIYRIFLVVVTGFFGLWGFIIGLIFVIVSIITTPTFANRSYFWPLYPFNFDALKTLLFRYPTYKAQPSTVWDKK